MLEYGDDPEFKYREDFNSFKIMTVWSQPEVKSVDELPADLEIHESPEESPLEPKRLVTAIEFSITKGGYLFIETPGPHPDWINRVFSLLREEGWQGHSFNEIRVDCRGDIEIEKAEDYTAVIDRQEGKVFHNRGVRKGSGKMESLEEWERT